MSPWRIVLKTCCLVMSCPDSPLTISNKVQKRKRTKAYLISFACSAFSAQTPLFCWSRSTEESPSWRPNERLRRAFWRQIAFSALLESAAASICFEVILIAPCGLVPEKEKPLFVQLHEAVLCTSLSEMQWRSRRRMAAAEAALGNYLLQMLIKVHPYISNVRTDYSRRFLGCAGRSSCLVSL